MVGSWEIEVKEGKLPQVVATGFASVIKDIEGADYVPVLYVGKQLVNGTNYMIICKQTYVDKERTEHLVSLVLNEKNNEFILLSVETIL